MRMHVRVLCVSSLFGALAMVQQAVAGTYTYDFDTIVSGSAPSGTNVATLTFSDVSANTVRVTLDHNATSASGQFITRLWFNMSPFISPTQSAQTPSNKFNGTLGFGLDAMNSTGLNFDFEQQFQTSNAGGGANRLKPGESASFLLTGSGLNASLFNATATPNGGNRSDIIAMIHLQGIPGGDSVKLGATAQPVPEPATMAALGLGALALVRKRRNRR